MNWLLWREYRRNRIIVATGGVLVLLSSVSAFFLALDRNDLFAPDGFVVLLFSALTLATLAGNAIAGDRADRTAEFIAYLPLPRSHLLISKLSLSLIAVVVLSAANLLTLMQQVEFQPLQKRPDSLHVFGLVVSICLLICGVSWLVSAILSSPALATLSGIFAALISAGVADLTGMIREVSPTFSEPGWWFTMNLIMAVGCFWIGSWYYLRRSEL